MPIRGNNAAHGRRSVILTAVVLAMAAFAPSAGANAYCLNADSLCAGHPERVFAMTQAGLSAAVAAAVANPGADSVEIGAGSIDISSKIQADIDSSNELVIRGANGAGPTLHFTSPNASGLVLNAAGTTASKISDLNVKRDGSAYQDHDVLFVDGAKLERVNFKIRSSNGAHISGAALMGASCENCTFDLATNGAVGLHLYGSSTTSRSVFRATGASTETTTGLVADGQSVVVQSSQFVDLNRAAHVNDDSALNLRDSTIDMGSGAGARGVHVVGDVAASPAAQSMTANIDGVTLVGDGDSQRAVDIDIATESPNGRQGAVNIASGLFVLTGASATEVRCSEGQNGTASVAIDNSWVNTVTPQIIGGCASSLGTNHHRDVLQNGPNEFFVNYAAGDLRPKVGGWPVDSGDPAASTSGRTFDAIGGNRFVGYWGLTPRMDAGGIEYQDWAPNVPKVTAAPATIVRGASVSFTATSVDGNGDGVSFLWDFGDGATATEQNPSHTFASIGTFKVQVRAGDGALQSEPAVATVTVTGPASPPAGSDNAGATAPAITFAKFSAKVRFASRSAMKDGFAVLPRKPKGASAVVENRGVTKAVITVSSAKGALKGKQTLSLPEGTSYLVFRGKWNKKFLPSGKYSVHVLANGSPTRLSMSLTTPK
ncbi:MAG: PKD domain-containing protein [Thermoleophilaceae bacterium]|nr:PKD domain-containing protein [Thermoleophilaceae bacterium]